MVRQFSTTSNFYPTSNPDYAPGSHQDNVGWRPMITCPAQPCGHYNCVTMTSTPCPPADPISSVDAGQLKAMLHDGGEIALLDVREAGQFGESHLLFATSVPYSRLELEIFRLVPRLSVRLVICDDGELGVARLAAGRLAMLGYTDVATLDGGTRGWAAAGYTLFAGVNVPSKTFGELVEHAYHTPRITATELVRMRDAGEDFVIFDGRTFDEYRRQTIPGSTCCPNAELPYRIASMVTNPTTKIIVNCAGRTRSILGAQTLINFGIRNPVYALENGTQGWVLSGYPLEHGAQRKYPEHLDLTALLAQQTAAQKLMARHSIGSVTAAQLETWLDDASRTTFLFDVRTEEEYAAGTAPGAIHAPGGQLIQATDLWVGVRNARIVLLDSECVRAAVVASWLKQLGCDAYVLTEGVRAALRPRQVPAITLPPPASVTARELKSVLKAAGCTVFDLGASMSFRKAHIPGSRWSIRPRIAAATRNTNDRVVLVADNPELARLAAAELSAAGCKDIRLLAGGLKAWTDAGYPTAESPDTPPDRECIDYLFFVHDRHAGNQTAMKQYLAWETGLLAQLDEQDLQSFRVNSPSRRIP